MALLTPTAGAARESIMGCNSSITRVGSGLQRQPPSKQMQTEEEMAAKVDAAKAAFEPSNQADEDLLRRGAPTAPCPRPREVSGRIAAQRLYTCSWSLRIFEALMPRARRRHRTSQAAQHEVDQEARRKAQGGDDRRRAAQAAAATPAGPREGRAGGVYERREAQGG